MDGRDIVISVQNDREWANFCSFILRDGNIANEARFKSNTARVSHRKALDKLISKAFLQYSTTDLLPMLDEASIAYGQVRSVSEMAVHPALRTWPMPVDDRVLEMIAPPVRASWDSGRFAPAPDLGEHTETLRAEFTAPMSVEHIL